MALMTLLELPIRVDPAGVLQLRFGLIETDGATFSGNLNYHRASIEPHDDIDGVIGATVSAVNGHLADITLLDGRSLSFPGMGGGAIAKIRETAIGAWTEQRLTAWRDKREQAAREAEAAKVEAERKAAERAAVEEARIDALVEKRLAARGDQLGKDG